MPKGTPLAPKCPRCMRGKYGYPAPVKGVHQTGRVKARLVASSHSGFGAGGCSFYGHRGEMRCDDCGHAWFSTHPASGRVKDWWRDHGTPEQRARYASAPRIRRAGEPPPPSCAG
jgi:hypothetical protein